MRWVYLNDHYSLETEAFIPITDRGFLFGDGVFSTIKVTEGKALFLEEHLRRLEQDASSIGILWPNIDQKIIDELVERNQAFEGDWRLKIVLTGGHISSLCLAERQYGSLLITLAQYQDVPKARISLRAYPFPIMGKNAQIKTLSYFERLRVKHFALEQRCDDAITFDGNGYILETAFSNLFWIRGEEYYTPSPNLPLYYGVSIQLLEKKLTEEGIKFNYVNEGLDAILGKNHVYTINSMQGIQPAFI